MDNADKLALSLWDRKAKVKELLGGSDAIIFAAAADEIERLREALAEAADSIEEWGAYASPYFQDKWDLQGDIDKFRKLSKRTAEQ